MFADWMMVAVGVVLTAGTAIFVAAEFSLVALDPSLVERRAVEGDKRAKRVVKALRQLSTQLSGAQVGITLTTILLGYTTQKAMANLITKGLEGWEVAAAVATGVGVVVALIITNTFSMVFGELVPKNLALANPFATAGIAAPLQMGFTTALKPIVAALNGSANWILRRFGIEPTEEISGARSAVELAALVRHSAREGTLDMTTASLFTRSIAISELTAIDVMTDRGRVHDLGIEDTAADVVVLARKTGHSRFPVVGKDVDDIRGFVHLRKAVAVPYERRHEVVVTSSSLMSEAPRVPETMPLGPLLVQLRDEGLQMALVVDEYGGASGIVTLEDVVEEIVGEVADEHDPRRSGVHRSAQGQWTAPGVLRPDELESATGLQVVEDGPFETLGGLVMDALGRIPEVGDVVESGEARLQVSRMDGMRVDRLQITALVDADNGSDSGEGRGGKGV
ncbi:MAG: hemolysin family protein [Actinomycetaceae bacterium]|nr:hemolysin family protein [Actinomycetaceae bacterium]